MVRGLDLVQWLSDLRLRRYVAEIEERSDGAIRQVEAPADAGRTGGATRRERLAPPGLYDLTDGIGSRREPREHVLPVRVTDGGRVDGASQLDAPAGEVRPGGRVLKDRPHRLTRPARWRR